VSTQKKTLRGAKWERKKRKNQKTLECENLKLDNEKKELFPPKKTKDIQLCRN
jgi:hypothetical protein